MLQSGPGILHAIVSAFFSLLILAMFVRVILSWIFGMMNMPQGHPVLLFFYKVTDPIIQPVARRIPHASLGAIDVGTTVAFIFTWWVLNTLSGVIVSALPPSW